MSRLILNILLLPVMAFSGFAIGYSHGSTRADGLLKQSEAQTEEMIRINHQNRETIKGYQAIVAKYEAIYARR